MKKTDYLSPEPDTINEEVTLDARLQRHPLLRHRVCALLNIVESELGTLDDASDAEMSIIEELRKMGKEVLQDWAEVKHEQVVQETKQSQKSAIVHVKKNNLAFHSR